MVHRPPEDRGEGQVGGGGAESQERQGRQPGRCLPDGCAEDGALPPGRHPRAVAGDIEPSPTTVAGVPVDQQTRPCRWLRRNLNVRSRLTQYAQVRGCSAGQSEVILRLAATCIVVEHGICEAECFVVIVHDVGNLHPGDRGGRCVEKPRNPLAFSTRRLSERPSRLCSVTSTPSDRSDARTLDIAAISPKPELRFLTM